MKRVRLRTTMAGPEFSGPPGAILDVPDHLADGLIAGGYAELLPAGEARQVETADATPRTAETTTEPHERKRKR